MNRNFSLKFKKVDILAIVIALVVAMTFIGSVLIYSSSKKQRIVHVYHDNQILTIYDTDLNSLSETKTIVLTKEEYPSLLGDFYIDMDKKKGIRVHDVTCPHKTCVNQGWVNIDNLPITCIPNDVSVVITSSKTDDSEIIVGYKEVYIYE